MGRCMIVVNQTAGGRALEAAIEERIAAGRTSFHVVVPMTEPRYETDLWAADTAAFKVQTDPAAPHPSPLEEARQRSERRLDAIIDRIRAAGGVADGDVGDQDPVKAARQALEAETFDEVIVSTLPSKLSRWLHRDVPSKLAKAIDVPVAVVEAESAEG